jgi:gliding motility-associated-like protein
VTGTAPTVDIIGLLTINLSESTTLTATGTPVGGTYSWSPTTHLTPITGGVVNVAPLSSANYTVTYNIGNSCTAVKTVTVVVNNPNLGLRDTTICQGSTVTLTANPAVLGGSFSWLPGGETTESITVSPSSTTAYSLNYNLNGVVMNQVATVTVINKPTVNSNSSTICSGQSATLAATGMPSGGSYNWQPGGQTSNSITVTPSLTTNYNVIYTLNGCKDTSVSVVTVNQKPTVDIRDTTICKGQTVTISAIVNPSGGTYNWGSQSTPSITLTPMSTTPINLLYTVNGCSSAASGVVTVNSIPTVSVTKDTICPGEVGSISAIGIPSGGFYSWMPNLSTTSSLTASPVTTTSYNVTYTLNNCSISATGEIVVKPLPTISVVNDSICAGETGQLVAVPSLIGGNFSWLPGGETTPSISKSPSITSQYTVTYTLNGCNSVANASIVVNEAPSADFIGDNLGGCAPLSVNLTSLNSSSGSNQTWSFSNGIVLNGGSANYTFLQGGCYDVTLNVEKNGCVGTKTIQSYICVDAKPKASFISNPNEFTQDPQTISFTNTSEGAVSYIWDFTDGNSFNENPSHVFYNTSQGYLVTLTAISNLGCTDQTQVFIGYSEGEVFYVPNSFTPDGDGFNQTFKPVFRGGFDPYNFEMLIFNRWGELVFETHDVNIGWDGSYGTEGKDVHEGTYTYKITYKNPKRDERKNVVGHIVLIK